MKKIITLMILCAITSSASAAWVITNNTQHLLAFEMDVAGVYQSNRGTHTKYNVVEPGQWVRNELNGNGGATVFSESTATRHFYQNGDGTGNASATHFLADGNQNGATNDVIGTNQLGINLGAGASGNFAYQSTKDDQWATTGFYIRIQNTTGDLVTDWIFAMDIYFGETTAGNSILQFSYAIDNGTNPNTMTFTTFGATLTSTTGDVITNLASALNETVTTAGVANGDYIILQIADITTSNTSDVYLDNIGITALAPTVTEIPDTPTNLTATASSFSSINLNWNDASDNESGFYIERGADTNSFVIIATNAPNIVTFADSSLSGATEYFYRVSAFNFVGSSSENPIDSATTLNPAAPVAPSGFHASAVSATAIHLAWTDNSDNETGFVIERKTTGPFSVVATVAADATSASDIGLTLGTTYTYRVKSTNAIGDSSYTAESSATPVDTGLPPKERMHVYVLLGQSNMQSTGGRYFAEDLITEARIMKYEPIRIPHVDGHGDWDETDFTIYNTGYYPYFVGNWVDFKAPACFNKWIPGAERYYPDWTVEESLKGVGPGRSVAREILKTIADPEVKIGIVGLAIPGERIARWVKDYSTHYPDIPVTDSGLFYTNNLRVLKDIQQFATIKGVLWHQGEADSGNTLYADMLKRVINGFRMDLGIPDLTWVCGQIGIVGDETVLVNSQLQSIVDEGFPNFGVASSSNLVLNAGDTIHYDRDSQWLYGTRYAAKFLEVRPTNPPVMGGDDGIFNVSSNGLGFNISGDINQIVIVKACTNLNAGIWFPLKTNTLTTGVMEFWDPLWTNFNSRFYHVCSE